MYIFVNVWKQTEELHSTGYGDGELYSLLNDYRLNINALKQRYVSTASLQQDPQKAHSVIFPSLILFRASCLRFYPGIYLLPLTAKTYIPTWHSYLFISWSERPRLPSSGRCVTLAAGCVSGYVTAREAVRWRGVKLKNRAMDYRGNDKMLPLSYCHFYIIRGEHT